MNLLILTATIELFIEVGYFVKIGGADVNYRTFCEIVIFLFSFIVLFRRGRLKYTKDTKNGMLFGFSAIIGLVFLVSFPSAVKVSTIDVSWDDVLLNNASLLNPRLSGFVIQQTFQFFMVISILMALYVSFDRSDLYKFLNKFTKIIRFFLILGCIEFVLKYVLRFEGYNDFLEYIFGLSESTIKQARLRGFGVELQGFTKEASHYAYVLFVSTSLLFAQKVISSLANYYTWIFIGIFLMIFSMSFSVLLYGTGMFAIFILYRWSQVKGVSRIKNQIFIVSIFSILVVVFFTQIQFFNSDGFFSRRIVSLFEEFEVISNNSWQKADTAIEWSNRVRLLSVFMSFKAFLIRPIWGFGLGTVTSHGSTIMMLNGAGLIGIYFWIKFFFLSVSKKFDIVNYRYLSYSIFIFLFVNSLNSMALRPFYELHTFLFAIALTGIFSKNKKNESINNHSCLQCGE